MLIINTVCTPTQVFSLSPTSAQTHFKTPPGQTAKTPRDQAEQKEEKKKKGWFIITKAVIQHEETRDEINEAHFCLLQSN